jgi:hypothetical protein
MSLPAALLQHVEQHGCFTGCYGCSSNVQACLNPGQPLQPMVVVSCSDCFAHVGTPSSLLPAGCDTYKLADQLTKHLRAQRGYAWSVGGYHARGPGFWLSAVYFGSGGLFLLDGEKSKALGGDLTLLLLAFQHGVAPASDPRMMDPKQYATRNAYVRFAPPLTPVASLKDLLNSPHCRTQPANGFQRVTVAEFQPLVGSVRAAPAPAAGAAKKPTAAAARPLKVGDVCPVCGAEVRERMLLQGTFVGCLC